LYFDRRTATPAATDREENLSGFFLLVIHKFFKRFTFLDEFTLFPANFNMDSLASFSLLAGKVTHQGPLVID
jgi:hypothetical protein